MTAGLDSDFRKYLVEAIGQENAAVAFSALEEPASVSVRLNPYKERPVFGAVSGPVPWSRYGVFLDARPVFTCDPFFHGGAYYVQDSSSMFVGHVFRTVLGTLPGVKDRPVRVLDLCAAPGGKTTDLAASLREAYGSGFVLVSNEVMRQRVSVLASNVAVWGDPCVVVTCDDPSRFSSMKGWFDVILADVPCSGEGMFRKDSQAREQWSADTVAMCQARQRRILADVWPALSEGGVLIYSTCTFNRHENDDNVEWAASALGADILEAGQAEDAEGVLRTRYGFCLVPGLVRGEGQFCAVLRKTGESGGDPVGKKCRSRFDPAGKQESEEIRGYFTEEMEIVSRDGFIKALPSSVAEVMPSLEGSLHVLASGCAVGQRKHGQLVPDADLPLSILYRKGSFREADMDQDTALSYLSGNPLTLKDAPCGYLEVSCRSLPLGFVKNLGSRCNNLYPRGRRIRMDYRK